MKIHPSVKSLIERFQRKEIHAAHSGRELMNALVHLALGRACKECGGVNMSALHLDIVKDLREQGEIHLDGKMVFETGSFLI